LPALTALLVGNIAILLLTLDFESFVVVAIVVEVVLVRAGASLLNWRRRRCQLPADEHLTVFPLPLAAVAVAVAADRPS